MKRKLLYLFCILFAFASCKKKNEVAPIPTNTITANAGGINVSFNINAGARFLNVLGGMYTTALSITGQSSKDYPAKVINISLTAVGFNAITKGTFVSTATDTSPNVLPSIEITDQSNSNTNVFGTDLARKYTTTVTITAISSTNVQGTFSGTLVSYLDGTITETITNGKFNVNIK